MMVAVRAWRPGQIVVDAAVGAAAALLTTAGSWDKIASWLPHSAIVPLALGQGLLLLARRWVPMVVLSATTLVGVFMLVVGYPAVPAVAGSCCAAYALAMHGRRAQEAELAGTLRGAVAALVAAVALAVAATAPGARDQPGSWSSFTLGAMVAASWI